MTTRRQSSLGDDAFPGDAPARAAGNRATSFRRATGGIPTHSAKGFVAFATSIGFAGPAGRPGGTGRGGSPSGRGASHGFQVFKEHFSRCRRKEDGCAAWEVRQFYPGGRGEHVGRHEEVEMDAPKPRSEGVLWKLTSGIRGFQHQKPWTQIGRPRSSVVSMYVSGSRSNRVRSRPDLDNSVLEGSSMAASWVNHRRRLRVRGGLFICEFSLAVWLKVIAGDVPARDDFADPAARPAAGHAT